MKVLDLVLRPMIWIGLCLVIELFAAYREILNWTAFSDRLLGVGSAITAVGGSAELEKITYMLGANQGVYNLFLAAAIGLWFTSFFTESQRGTLCVFGLAAMVCAGVFGVLSALAIGVATNYNLMIFAAQAGAPVIALVALRRAQGG